MGLRALERETRLVYYYSTERSAYPHRRTCNVPAATTLSNHEHGFTDNVAVEKLWSTNAVSDPLRLVGYLLQALKGGVGQAKICQMLAYVPFTC